MFKPFKFILLSLFLIQSSFSEEQQLSEQSTLSPLAINSLLLQSDRQGSLTVVVGERGHVLYSQDNENWNQAVVNTKQTLTNVFMHDEKTGWAVGHDAIILKTEDGARTWRKVFSDLDEEAPLLDIYFKDNLNGVAIGAYALIYETEDGGINWNKSELILSSNNDIEEQVEADTTDIFDIHLNDIAFAGNQRFYIAAEAGHILRSDDDGKNWINLNLPYRGSFFGVLPLSFYDVIAFGLRGHLYISSDAGVSWVKVETGSDEMLTDAVVLSDGTILLSGLAGTLLLSKDKGKSFTKLTLNHRNGLNSILETKMGSIVLTGEAGVQLLSQEIIMGHE